MAIAVVVIAVALALLAPRTYYALTHVTTDDAYVDAYPAVVTARVSGAVVAIPVREGQQVKRGSIVARLDDTDARAQVLTARQQLLAAKAALAQAEYEAGSQSALHSAQQLRASALAGQSGDLTRSMQLSEQSGKAVTAASQESISEAQAALDAASAQIPAAKTQLDNARALYLRMQKLVPQGIISMTQVEAAQNGYAQAQASYTSALSSVAQAKANLAAARAKAQADELQAEQAGASARAQAWGETFAQSEALANSGDALAARQAAVTAQRAQVAAAQQALNLAQYKLSETVLRSPVDGYVASRPATIGEALQGGDPAVVIMPSGGLYVTANFKETQFDRIRDGAPADVHIDAFPKVRFYGHVQALGAASQSALSIAPNTQVSANFVKITQRVPVRVVIDRASVAPVPVLRPGMSAEVSVAH
jgi:membrane fusion protein (multidrug efflux system)